MLTTPTPFPTPTAVLPIGSGGVQIVTLAELMAEPTLYQNQRIEVTGQFTRLPRQVCGSLVTTYRLPASFSLRDGDVTLYGAGLGAGREIAPEGLTMTINGRLLPWIGPVGCGKRATIQEIWYIETSRVVSPRPLTSATLTPEAFIADVNGLESPTPTVDEFDLPPTMTPTPEPDRPDVTPSPSPSPTATLTPTPDTEDDEDETLDETPTPTPTGDFETAFQGELASGDLVGGRLTLNEIHEWRFAIRASDILTVSAIADQGNLVLRLYDESGELVQEQNEAPPLAVESITGLELSEPGEYRLLVSVADGQTADYHLLFLLSDSYTFVMQGLLFPEVEEMAEVRADSDHSWHFAAMAGDTVGIMVIPLDEMDAYFRLYDPAGDLVLGETGRGIFVDEEGPGLPEELLITLPETGLYAVQVGDMDFESGAYIIVIFFDM